MKRTVALIAAFMFFSVPLRAEEVVLPKGISIALETEYPGWNLAPISKLLVPLDARDKYTNVLHRDLDGDGKPDYALLINYIDSENNVKTGAVAFMARGNEFREYTLSEMFLGSDHHLVFVPGDTVLHWVHKGDKGYQVGEDEDSNLNRQTPVPVYPADAVEVINLRKAVAAFKWDSAGFQLLPKAREHE